MKLGGLFDKSIVIEFEPLPPDLFALITGGQPDEVLVAAIITQALPLAIDLGSAATIESNLLAALYQDDDAHDTCTLTACLNPLHPGPCKGWKGTLFDAAPAAWHALEAAKVDKANARRVKRIEELKAKGLPIPHKLLTPIVAKPHPHAGQTAKSATGEAHAAGKAVSEAAGIHNSHPGKVTLGQAVKPLTPVEKGPKGKKPTLASKGIAFVISQPKVTDQYKLDKAAAITAEQWAGLSAEDKGTIRGELAKIQKDGFGPQQKKATELLDKLAEKPTPELKSSLPPAPHIYDPSYSNATNWALHNATTSAAVQHQIPAWAEMTADDWKGLTPADHKKISDAIASAWKHNPQDRHKIAAAMLNGTEPGTEMHADFTKKAANKYSPAMATAATLHNATSLGKTASVKEQLGHDLSQHLSKSEFDSLTPGEQASVTKQLTKQLSSPHKSHQDQAKAKLAELSGTPELKPGTPDTITAPSGKVYQKVTLKTASSPEKATTVDKAKVAEILKEAKGPSPVSAATLGATAKSSAKIPASEKPKDLPKHVQEAIDMANGHAPGATWSKNHLAAYQHLSADEFHALPKDVQGKVVAELAKGQSKFLDPKKIQASKDLLAKFGKGAPSAPGAPKPEAPKAAEHPVYLSTHLHDHDITQAQAKDAAAKAAPANLFIAAQQAAGLTAHDNPDSHNYAKDAQAVADVMVDMQTKPYEDDPKILSQPDVHAAVEHLGKTTADLKVAQKVQQAKASAFNKIAVTLANDKGQLSPMQKAALNQYGKYLLAHPVDTDQAHLDKLQQDTVTAVNDLNDKLQKAKAHLNAPKPEDMSKAQVEDRAKELLGSEAVQPAVHLTLAETKYGAGMGEAQAIKETENYPPGVITDPVVASKFNALKQASIQVHHGETMQAKLDDHLKAIHEFTLANGTDVHGTPLTAADKKVIQLHAENLKADHAYLGKSLTTQKQKLVEAKEQFHAAAVKATLDLKPAEPHKLSDYDQVTVGDAYADAWGTQASKAVVYGVKTYGTKEAMKAHPDYAPLTQDLGQLKHLARKLAVAHAEEHTADQYVPTHPDTGNPLAGPEMAAYDLAVANRVELEKQFNDLHKQAQARLDAVRTSVGLKKRALPKLDSAAVKATAAEKGYYKTGSYSGPNYGSPTKAKAYMLAKAGPKIGVTHQTASEKKLVALGVPAGKAPSTPKIENMGGKPTEPVKLGGDSSIAHIPDALKKQVTSDFKNMPDGKYLADPAEDIFDNLVNLAAAHGKTVPGGLSVDQVLKTIDETHSKNLGVPNSGMLHKKVTDWLGTTAGKQYAEQHSTPDAKVVKQISGELDLPKGVTLAPGEKVQKLAGPGPHDAALPSTAFKAATSSQAQAAQDASMKANGIKWSAQQKTALKSYTGSAYQTYNAYLRGNGSATASTKQHVIDIQSAMVPLGEHTLLKRGTGWDAIPAQFHGANASKMVGKTFEEPGFTSTTVAGMGGHFSGQPLQLIIEAPAGTPGAFVNGISHFKDQENEMLLAAGTKFKVLSVEKTTGGHTLMRVRIVGDK